MSMQHLIFITYFYLTSLCINLISLYHWIMLLIIRDDEWFMTPIKAKIPLLCMSHYISGCIKDLLLPFCTLVRHLTFYVFIKRVNDMMGDNTIRFVCIVLFNSFKADGQIFGWCVISSCVIMCSYSQMVQQKLILYPLCAIPLLLSFLSIDVIMATNWYSHWVCWWHIGKPGHKLSSTQQSSLIKS